MGNQESFYVYDVSFLTTPTSRTYQLKGYSTVPAKNSPVGEIPACKSLPTGDIVAQLNNISLDAVNAQMQCVGVKTMVSSASVGYRWQSISGYWDGLFDNASGKLIAFSQHATQDPEYDSSTSILSIPVTVRQIDGQTDFVYSRILRLKEGYLNEPGVDQSSGTNCIWPITPARVALITTGMDLGAVSDILDCWPDLGAGTGLNAAGTVGGFLWESPRPGERFVGYVENGTGRLLGSVDVSLRKNQQVIVMLPRNGGIQVARMPF